MPVLSAPGTSASPEVILTAECPVVAYRRVAADLCAAYGLASAVLEYGDVSGAAAVAAWQRRKIAPLCAARVIKDASRGEVQVAAPMAAKSMPCAERLLLQVDLQ